MKKFVSFVLVTALVLGGFALSMEAPTVEAKNSIGNIR